ncbi:pterin-4-alpha-carbinolamine dehydratase 2, mitochondrial [Rosa rugosa]|uniref:pterin-4-alpha-carbinolamine dehydratase 2, mitochondrial n=1 Tax=Rosa rugosa TaxID=74645 RepID=UPI002B403783|nr:pterin-4-alpha-carbinolamine dehydratase 2, mitochondrial [Rosa rugosa]
MQHICPPFVTATEKPNSPIFMSRMLQLPFPKVAVVSVFQNLFGAHGRSSSRVYEILQNNVRVSSGRNSVSGFRTFCTGQDLSTKKCVPCSSKDMRPMTEESASNLLPKVDGWNMVSESGLLKLKKSWRVKSFTKGMEMFKLIADVAEAEGHHPDLHLVGWNNVTIEIWTHAVGGLTENDFILAAKINALDMQNLMRRKATD